MNPDTEVALRESIKHWEGIVAGTEASSGSRNCALCQRFRTRGVGVACTTNDEVCPVAIAVGECGCRGTPYERFEKLADRSESKAGRWAFTPEAKAVAREELEFLKSLLPPTKEEWV